jgi:hypothetical protein
MRVSGYWLLLGGSTDADDGFALTLVLCLQRR